MNLEDLLQKKWQELSCGICGKQPKARSEMLIEYDKAKGEGAVYCAGCYFKQK